MRVAASLTLAVNEPSLTWIGSIRMCQTKLEMENSLTHDVLVYQCSSKDIGERESNDCVLKS